MLASRPDTGLAVGLDKRAERVEKPTVTGGHVSNMSQNKRVELYHMLINIEYGHTLGEIIKT